MRHHDSERKFGRKEDERRAFLRSLARNLILKETIITTEARAKSLRPFVERLVTKSKVDTVANRRLILARLGNNKEAMSKLFATLGPRYKERRGGYIRIVRIEHRAGDAAVRTHIGFV